MQWTYASSVARLCLLYEDTRMRYHLLSFSCTLLVTEESGGCVTARAPAPEAATTFATTAPPERAKLRRVESP